MINDRFAALLELAADVDEILLFRRHSWSRGRELGELRRFCGDLRREPWDWVVDFQGLLRSGLTTCVARSSRKIGFAAAREGAPIFYGTRVQTPPEVQHAVAKNLHLVSQVTGEPAVYEPSAWRTPPELVARADAIWAESGLAACSEVVAVAPAARWQSKSWPPDFFAATMRRLAEARPGVGFWLLGSADDAAAGEAVLAAGAPATTANLIGRTDMHLLLALLRRSQGMLTNDSGPMHLAAAVDVPTVALFGPTSPVLTGPYGDRHVVLASRVECAPCMQRICPLPKQLCRDDVASPAAAATALTDILASRA